MPPSAFTQHDYDGARRLCGVSAPAAASASIAVAATVRKSTAVAQPALHAEPPAIVPFAIIEPHEVGRPTPR